MGAKTGLIALVDRCLVRLVDSEGETQREVKKDTRLGMCACIHCLLFVIQQCMHPWVSRPPMGVYSGRSPISRNCSYCLLAD